MYLIDTDTIIYAMKGDRHVVKQFGDTAAQPKALSVIILESDRSRALATRSSAPPE